MRLKLEARPGALPNRLLVVLFSNRCDDKAQKQEREDQKMGGHPLSKSGLRAPVSLDALRR
jgi:hypothetical protein